MGNSHPGWKTRLVERTFRGRAFDEKFWQEHGHEAMRVSEALKKFGARAESDKITPETFAPSGLTHQFRIAPLGIDIPTQRSGIRFGQAGRDRVRGSIFKVPFHFISLTLLRADEPAIGRRSDVEQWKHIPRKAELGTQAFL